jgi:Fe-S-cluster-containing dehydrogenase component
MRYGIVVDLSRCLGCRSCQVACKVENFVPPDVFFMRVLTREVGTYPNAKMDFIPVQCNQCEHPHCVDACPTGATTQRADGIVTIDADKCVGCRACMIACPYRQRFYLPLKKKTYFATGATPYEEIGQQLKDYQGGTVVKCDFCIDRVEKGLKPACVATCPCYARYFGDLDDPKSEVSQLIANRKGFTLLPEMGTEPSVWYVR